MCSVEREVTTADGDIFTKTRNTGFTAATHTPITCPTDPDQSRPHPQGTCRATGSEAEPFAESWGRCWVCEGRKGVGPVVLVLV